MATGKAPEKAPETSSTSKSDAEIFQLEALSLNYLRSQNVLAIPDDDYIPKLHPCKLCNKAILSFRFEAFTALTCGHLFHRICLEIHIIRGATKYPACPTCKTDIEIFREETALASGECDVIPRRYDKGKASQQSNVTIDDDMEFMQELGLIAEKDSSSVEITKQVNVEDRGTSSIANNPVTTQEQTTSPIANNSISTQEQTTNPITNEKGTANVVQVNSTDQNNTNETTDSTTSTLKRPNPIASTNSQSTKKVKKSDEKKDSNVIKKLIEELSVETPQVSEINEESTGNFHDLYLAINRAEEQSERVNQLVIKSYYDFGKAFEERYESYRKNNPKRTAQALVNKEVGKQLPNSVSETSLRKRKERAQKIYELFSEIGVGRIQRVKSFTALMISKLSQDDIDVILVHFAQHQDTSET